MAKKDRFKNDDFLKKMDRLLENSEAEKETPNEVTTPGIKETLEGLSILGGFINKSVVMGKYAWEKVGAPIWDRVSPIGRWVGRNYMDKIWNKFSYTKDENGEDIFSKKRAGIVLTATFALAALAPTILSGTVNMTVDSAKMLTTMRTESVYLHSPNTHMDNTYSVKGCETAGKCDIDDVVYYNIETSGMKNLWSLFNKGSLYVPKRIVGTISPDSNNKCEVKIYGAHYENLMEQFDVHPELLDISCEQVNLNGSSLTP